MVLISSDYIGNHTFIIQGHKIRFRVITPKDFYSIEHEDMSLLEICFLLCKDRRTLGLLPLRIFTQSVLPVLETELINGRLLQVRQWLEIAFQLQKRQWSNQLDWLEKQPIDKILVFADVMSDDARQGVDFVDMLDC
jgi:hypothetical protein